MHLELQFLSLQFLYCIRFFKILTLTNVKNYHLFRLIGFLH